MRKTAIKKLKTKIFLNFLQHQKQKKHSLEFFLKNEKMQTFCYGNANDDLNTFKKSYSLKNTYKNTNFFGNKHVYNKSVLECTQNLQINERINKKIDKNFSYEKIFNDIYKKNVANSTKNKSYSYYEKLSNEINYIELENIYDKLRLFEEDIKNSDCDSSYNNDSLKFEIFRNGSSSTKDTKKEEDQQINIYNNLSYISIGEIKNEKYENEITYDKFSFNYQKLQADEINFNCDYLNSEESNDKEQNSNYPYLILKENNEYTYKKLNAINNKALLSFSSFHENINQNTSSGEYSMLKIIIFIIIMILLLYINPIRILIMSIFRCFKKEEAKIKNVEIAQFYENFYFYDKNIKSIFIGNYSYKRNKASILKIFIAISLAISILIILTISGKYLRIIFFF